MAQVIDYLLFSGCCFETRLGAALSVVHFAKTKDIYNENSAKYSFILVQTNVVLFDHMTICLLFFLFFLFSPNCNFLTAVIGRYI